MDPIETTLSQFRASVPPVDADALALRTGWRPGGGTVTTRRPRRRPLLIAATAALAAGTAAVTVTLSAGADHASDGRPFMLTAATKVEHAPGPKKCWYVRSYDIFGDTGDGPVRLGTARPGPGASQMLEKWTCPGVGVRTTVTYPAGKGKTTTTDYRRQFSFPYKLQLDQVRAVRDPASMERLVRRAYTREDRSKWYPSFPSFEEYVWLVSRDLMTSDIPPKPKAALYRLLASQKGITDLGKRKDQIGRAGVAISLRMPKGGPKSDGDNRLSIMLFDPATGDFMAQLTGQQTVVEKMGWVAHKGDRL